MGNSSFEKQLIDIGYHQLFLSGDNTALQTIWDKGSNQAQLQFILGNEEGSGIGKLLANEVLLHFHVEVDPTHFAELAFAYTECLRLTSGVHGNQVRLSGNDWGLLYDFNDPGPLGKRFIWFGESAIPSLKKILNEDSGGYLYAGSKEALIGNSYQFRTKDFAAFYLSHITMIPITFYEDFPSRDQELEEFKTKLDSF